MPTPVTTPDIDEPCAYCGSRIFEHDPICLRDCTDDCGSPVYFCNHSCMSAYVDRNDLTAGESCNWSSDEPCG